MMNIEKRSMLLELFKIFSISKCDARRLKSKNDVTYIANNSKIE